MWASLVSFKHMLACLHSVVVNPQTPLLPLVTPSLPHTSTILLARFSGSNFQVLFLCYLSIFQGTSLKEDGSFLCSLFFWERILGENILESWFFRDSCGSLKMAFLKSAVIWGWLRWHGIFKNILYLFFWMNSILWQIILISIKISTSAKKVKWTNLKTFCKNKIERGQETMIWGSDIATVSFIVNKVLLEQSLSFVYMLSMADLRTKSVCCT